MIRIRGNIGETAVDLTVEMDADDWARLGAQLPVTAEPGPAVPAAPRNQNDALWQTALRLVEQAGQVSGPQLLEQLEGLAGSTAAGKRLLVRLRHSSQVAVQAGDQAPVYCWVGAKPAMDGGPA
ncbi:hypothetical protein SFA35_23295 [Pseudomonas sp. HR96]|uniref:hypothetical protein n=1 Tax=Pseudomonas sp. HR96 TaxID=1027966 RepID=UPI002A74C5A9|nr:hypothetical protein [Pseudomonas sp. HR96]WPO99489.1 hypothetical protein SFA35_23295 [Pseudomonas sp. HR96]